jgi:hypothetical protein
VYRRFLCPVYRLNSIHDFLIAPGKLNHLEQGGTPNSEPTQIYNFLDITIPTGSQENVDLAIMIANDVTVVTVGATDTPALVG